MAYGVPSQVANTLGQETYDSMPSRSIATGLTATGTTISDALALTALVNIITTTAASTGVKLPSVGQDGWGQPFVIKNAGANTLNIFPNSTSEGFNRGTPNGTAITLAAGSTATIRKTTATNWES
jgi:hypothetical protein